MPRMIRVAAAQMGPTQRADTRVRTLGRILALLERAAVQGARLVVFPELAFTTFFPRWLMPAAALEAFTESAMPNPAVQPLFDRARELGVGFSIGYAERAGERLYNSAVLVTPDGRIMGRYRKVHLPGSVEPRPGEAYQQLEKRYFAYGDTGFPVWRAPASLAGGLLGMMICNDRRWPESWRMLGLQGVELVCLGYNSAAYDPNGGASEGAELRTFHSKLVVQANAYMNATWAVAVAKAGGGGWRRADRRVLHRRPEWADRGRNADAGGRGGGGGLRPGCVPPGQGEDVRFRRPTAARTSTAPSPRKPGSPHPRN